MRKLLSLVLFTPLISVAQNKPFLELGALAGFSPATHMTVYGLNIGINAYVDQNVKMGVGFMPTWLVRNEKAQLPLYGEIRFRLDKTVELLLQPGYNFFQRKASQMLATSQMTAHTKGGFYGGGGLSFNVPTKGKTGVFVQAKYNYFKFKATIKTTWGSSSSSMTDEWHNNAITLGLGVRLR